jgi:hypothetical protein
MPSIWALTQRSDCTTGFGAPVLPPLNLMICASRSFRGMTVGRRPFHSAMRPRTLGISPEVPLVLPSMTGAPMGVKRSRHDSSATNNVGRVAPIIRSRSARLFVGLSGTHTLAAAYVASRATRCSTVFRAQMPTRLAGSGSSDCNAAARACTAASNRR